MEPLSCLEAGPADADSTVIWLHGLGASGHDFADMPALMGLPRTRYVFPHAPRRAVTINLGLIMPAWYDIATIGSREDDEPGVRRSVAQVGALVELEERRGVPSERIVLAGFSQGGAIALFTGTRFPRRLGGIVVLSAYELFPSTRAAEAAPANRATAVLVCHGSQDPMVPVAAGREVQRAYAADGWPVEFHVFPMPHAVCLEEVQVVRRFLHERLAPPVEVQAAGGDDSPR